MEIWAVGLVVGWAYGGVEIVYLGSSEKDDCDEQFGCLDE